MRERRCDRGTWKQVRGERGREGGNMGSVGEGERERMNEVGRCYLSGFEDGRMGREPRNAGGLQS